MSQRMRVAVLGCSGSIGTQTLDVCRQHADKVEVTAISAHSDTAFLVSAAREFGCAHAVVSNDAHAHDAVLSDLPYSCSLGVGPKALRALTELDDVDCVVNALVGFAGIHAGYAALKAGKRLAYANKESIVVAGDLLMPIAGKGQLIPVDSEHSAIFQCLQGEEGSAADPSSAKPSSIYRIWLTCSGGPFYGLSREELATKRASDALAHPTWDMGAKITIDSSTLMNKGLEVLEAHHLFGVSVDEVNVLIQRTSHIHSMVEFADGSVKAQLGPADMRLPIQYALSYPDRWETPAPRIDWCHEPPIPLGVADEEAFGCLRLAREAGRAGGTLPCAMNAANEVANEAFRMGNCGFLDVERIVSGVMEKTEVEPVESIDQLVEVDKRSRALARGLFA